MKKLKPFQIKLVSSDETEVYANLHWESSVYDMLQVLRGMFTSIGFSDESFVSAIDQIYDENHWDERDSEEERPCPPFEGEIKGFPIDKNDGLYGGNGLKELPKRWKVKKTKEFYHYWNNFFDSDAQTALYFGGDKDNRFAVYVDEGTYTELTQDQFIEWVYKPWKESQRKDLDVCNQ